MNAHTLQRQPVFLIPWPVLVLIGLICAAYVAFALAPPDLQNRALLAFAFIPADYIPGAVPGGPTGAGLVLPFFGYLFLHGGLEHLVINCLWLAPFGAVTARRFGPFLFFAFFLICGASGAAFHLALNWGSGVAVIGASAAISGLMGAAFRMLSPSAASWGASARLDAPLQPLFSRQILTWSALWLGVNVIAGVTGMGTAGGGVKLIAWQAHMGGYLAGLLLAGPFAALALKLRRLPPHRIL